MSRITTNQEPVTGKTKEDENQPLGTENYTIGWICAITTEYVAAQVFLDKQHAKLEYQDPKDANDYTLGEIGKHNVAIAVLPDGEYGTSSAATVASNMQRSFANIKVVLMVGIGGGAPSSKHDIRLGDIVISTPCDGKGGVFQYDFGKTIQGQSFQPRGFLDQPSRLLRAAVNGLKAQYEIDGHQLEEAISAVLKKKPKLRRKYSRPDASTDRLYETYVIHPINDEFPCAIACGDDISDLVKRLERDADEDNPKIHYGLIASANQLMKDASARDKLAVENDVLCFEMEAAGLMNNSPCLVIRGICDYSDTHKNDKWQGYAAMAAAAYAKELLCRIPPRMVEVERKINERLFDTVETLMSNSEREEDRKILDWITKIDYGPQQSDFLDKRQLGTGEWLLKSNEYQGWLKGSQQTLHCPGIPGSGKTFLTSMVVQDLTTQFQHDTTIGVAYIYCNFRRKVEQSINYLLASLLKQLAQRQTSLPDSMKRLYSKHQRNRTKLSLGEIKDALSEVANMCSKVFVIIDALDECDETCRTMFVRELINLQAAAPVNIFTTSRPIISIENELKHHTTLKVSARDEDIHLYLNEHISAFQNFISKKNELQEYIKVTITGAVDGMFLLAHLYLESLRNKMTPRDIRDALELFRKKSEKAVTEDQKSEVLAQAYDDAMERIVAQSTERRILAKNFLSWIVFAVKPLTTLQLQHALAVKNGDREFDDQRIPDINDMISICAGLVTIENETRRVRLVHYTTQEYFEHTHANWVPDAAQSYITSTCTTYLALNPFNVNLMRGLLERQLKGYRTRLRKLFEEGELQKLHSVQDNKLCLPGDLGELNKLLHEHHLWGDLRELEHELSALDALCKSDGQRKESWRVLSQLRQLGMLSYLRWKFERHEVSHGCRKGSTLSLVHKYIEILCPFYIYASHYWGHHARHACASFQELASFLLNQPALKTSLLLWTYSTTERSALWNGIQLFPHKNLIGLHFAAYFCLEKVFLTLPDRYTLDNTHGTLLLCAVGGGNESMVRFLLRIGYDVNFQDKDGLSPLSSAIQGRFHAIARLLLENGADVDAQKYEQFHAEIYGRDYSGFTPLIHAIYMKDEAAVQLLLDHNADVTLSHPRSGTALLHAMNYWPKVAKLVAEKASAKMSPDGKFARESLMGAVQKGNCSIIQVLREHKVALDFRDEYGRTPLTTAVELKLEAVVKLLLQSGANIDFTVDKGDTALHRAARGHHATCLQVLLDYNADVFATNEEGQTPESIAAGNGYQKIAELLRARRLALQSVTPGNIGS